ncbi:MAG: hypothetical protein LBQ09_09615 [Acidobacteriaceae bacterium]|jgi:hypothetical protein|nr:hypothetical protein [Acidobacteriaceae bacterium]
MFSRVCAFTFAATAALLAQAPSTPDLPLIMAKAARFVSLYAGRTSGMVFEESYVQDVFQPTRFGYRITLRPGATHRTLKSDLLLVRPMGTDAWMQFRDVFEVDGRPLRDRSDRLQKLFLAPSKSTAQQIDKITKESARYNIGDIERTINIPLLGLSILDRDFQPNFQFTLDTSQEPVNNVFALPKTPEFTPPPGAIAVAFRETALQTMVRTPQGKNMAASGRFWFMPSTEHVVMTELRIDDWTLGAVVHVAYKVQKEGGLPLPVAMHEMYENKLNNQRVEGLATYSNFREFNVKTDEQITTPQQDK